MYLRNNNVVIVIIFGLFLIMTVGQPLTCNPLSTSNILYVNDDGSAEYRSIQNAVDNASEGDTIFVYNGTYYENIVIDTANVLLHGENRDNTIIDAGETTQDAVNVFASDVTIQGFTFTNAINDPFSWDVSGLKIYSLNVTVTGNTFVSNRLGISVMSHAYNATICNNSFVDDGILLGHYQEAHTLSKLDFLHTINHNTVNGKPLYYYKNCRDFVVPNDAGQVILGNCENVTIQDLSLSRTDFSVILGYCTNCTIENLTVSDTDGEVILYKSDYNIIRQNTLVNHLHGICLDYKSNYNVVRNNYAANSLVGISAVTSSSNNLICNNMVVANNVGIHISAFCNPDQHDNKIFNNTILNNEVGINIVKNSHENRIENNTIKSCFIGIQLKNSSDNNEIQYNTFKKNTISAVFLNCTENMWNKNYWSHPRLLPKIIFGYHTIANKLPLIWFNIDWHPVKEPYDIGR